MKKILVILVASFLLQSFVINEKMEPIAPRKPGTEVYSIAEAKAFALKDGSVNNWWRDSAIAIVNRALVASGESVRIDYSKIGSMFDYIKYEFKDLDPHWNSRLNNGVPEFFWDADGWSGTVAVFRYGKCVCILYKPGCMNLLNIPVKQSPFTPIVAPGILSKSDTVKVQTGQGQVVVVNNIYNNNIISNSGNSENNNDVQVGGPNQGTPTTTPVTYVLSQPTPSYQMSSPVVMSYPSQQQGFYQERSTSFGFGLNINLGGNGGGNYPQQQYVAPRGYMGGGRGTTTTGGQGYMGGGGGGGVYNPHGNGGGGRGN